MGRIVIKKQKADTKCDQSQTLNEFTLEEEKLYKEYIINSNVNSFFSYNYKIISKEDWLRYYRSTGLVNPILEKWAWECYRQKNSIPEDLYFIEYEDFIKNYRASQLEKIKNKKSR